MIRPWKKLKRAVLFEHPRLTLLEDVVQLPNGKHISYLLAAPPKHCSVSIVAVSDHDQILIQKQYNYPIRRVLWELPGGSTEAGESPEEAALRELAEEAKYTAKDVKVIGEFYTQNRFKDAKQYVVLCRDLRVRNLPSDESEFIETEWVSREELSAMISKGDIQNINMLASLKLYDEFIARNKPGL